MEFGWSDEHEAYRARIVAFLERTLPADWDEIALHGPGSDAQTDYSRHFCKLLDEEGLLIPHWPAEHGGEDLDTWQHYVIGEELWSVGEPRGGQYMNVNWVGPVLMKYGTAAQWAKYFPPIKAGEALWCQGFSEPSAGSDLAALRTMAVPVDGGYRVTGAKVWTSYAGHADRCFLLARVPARDGGPAGKAGIVILLVDMASAGIQVKQIPAIIGEGDIHEVFFDDVFVPAEDRLGAEGQAWEIINFALQNERTGIPRYAFSRRILDRSVAQMQAEGRFDDPVFQDRAGRALALTEAARMLVYRVVDQRAHKAPPDAFGNVARWAVVNADNGVNNLLTEYRPEGLLGADAMQQAHHQRAIAAGVASGAAEIQLNLVARRFLDLPSGEQRGL